MGGNLKNRKPVGLALDNDVYKQLKQYSEETMIPMSKIVDKAITEYLEKQDNKK